jgi:hypothetical protein
MQQLNLCGRRPVNEIQQRTEMDRPHIDNGMMHPGILHAEDHLENQTVFRDHPHKTFHPGMVQIEWLIAGINPKTRHFVILVTAPNIFLPIRPGQVDAAKRNQKAGTMLAAFGRQTRIDSTHIFGEQRLETPGPGLDDPVPLELCDQSFCMAVLQRAKWPVEQIDIRVDDARGRAMSGCLRRKRRLADKGNSGGAQQGVSQKTAAINGLHFQSRLNLHAFLAEDGCANPPQIPSENLHAIGF